MRHRKTGRKLNINSSHRKAMFRNMVTSLFKYDRIRTTDTKAKELRILADHLVTLAKRGDLHARRQALAVVREADVVHKLFEEAKERFGSVSGGYTRIVKIGRRPGDATLMSLIELVTPSEGKKKTGKKKAAPTAVVEKAPDVKPEETEEKAAPEKPEESAAPDDAEDSVESTASPSEVEVPETEEKEQDAPKK